MKHSGAQSRKKKEGSRERSSKMQKNDGGLCQAAAFSAESDGAQVQDDKLRSETSTHSNESETSRSIEMNEAIMTQV